MYGFVESSLSAEAAKGIQSVSQTLNTCIAQAFSAHVAPGPYAEFVTSNAAQLRQLVLHVSTAPTQHHVVCTPLSCLCGIDHPFFPSHDRVVLFLLIFKHCFHLVACSGVYVCHFPFLTWRAVHV